MLGKEEIPRGDGKLNTIIGKGSVFHGNIEVVGGLRVDGKIEGDVKAESVFVGREAEIVGDIAVNTAVVGGKIWGNVTTTILELQAKAELYGDVATRTLIVAEGVIMQGKCDMGHQERLRKRDATTAPAEGDKPEEPVVEKKK
jgi:cytoskeletal protein CcmA (bactofilin family)